MSAVSLPPLQWLHVLDFNTNIVNLVTGPTKYILKNNEKIEAGPFSFIKVPPGHYCMINDPCRKYVVGEVAKLAFGETEVRLHGEPFPLFPGEKLVGAENFGRTSNSFQGGVLPLPIIKANEAYRLRALIDHKDGEIERTAGDVWQIEGPRAYIPSPYVVIDEKRQATIIGPQCGVYIEALLNFTDRNGIKRITGDEWIITDEGSYIPEAHAHITKVGKAITLTDERAVHLLATDNITDSLGIKRKTGEEWLVTSEDTDLLFPQIGVDIVSMCERQVLNKGEFCVVLNPVDQKRRPQLGKQELRVGITSFFLHPGEELDHGIQTSFVLSADEALVISAIEEFEDKSVKGAPVRKPGDRWMVTGPAEYIPPVQVKVICERKSIPLNENEGIYVRDIQKGLVRAVMGPCSYMLTANEELFEKELESHVEEMLKLGGGLGSGDIRKMAYYEQSIDPAILKGRNKTKVVTYRCPGNTACQVYNYKEKKARILFGPELVVLGPYESFGVLSLSAGKPKKQCALKSLCLMLGPDFITDIIEVETSDHARLQIQLAFNNHFKFDKEDPVSVAKIFAVPDFIGFACKQIGSKIRAVIAQTNFDEFHRNSAEIIKNSVFGTDQDGNINSQLEFEANQLVISSVDVQSIEPVDLKMRESLLRSVQMAIEIATNSVEAAAKHEAETIEQEARGELDRQILKNERQAEEERIKLLQLKAISAAVESTGQAVAEAKAIAESQRIEGMSGIECAKLKMEATAIDHDAEMHRRQLQRASELAYQKAWNIIETEKKRLMTEIEVDKFKNMIDAIGKKTILALANAGPAAQLKLLKSLGIQSTLITDGNMPINLFNTANGLVALEK